MKASNTAYEKIKKWEGLLLETKKDMGGVPTIGYGHTGHVKMGAKITSAIAEAYLRLDVARVEKAIDATHISFNQNEYDALTVFGFNLGPGAVKTLTDGRSKSQIANAIPLYCHVGSRKVQGLVNRRADEQKLFLKPLNHYKVPTHKTVSIVAALNSLHVDSSMKHRARIAKANNISHYSGTAAENTLLCKLLYAGKLKMV